MDNPDEIDKLLETQNLSRLNYEGIGNLNRPLTSKKVESVIKNPPTKKSPGMDGFTGEFYQTFKEEITPILLKTFPKIEEEETLPNSFYGANTTRIPKPDRDTVRKQNYREISLMNNDVKILNKILANQIQ